MARTYIIFVLTLGLLQVSAAQQASSFELGSIETPRTVNPAANSNTPSSLAGQQQNPFLGSVPSGQPTATPIDLSLQDAIQRGVKANLGVIENQVSLRQSQAQRLRALSSLLPSVSALVRQNLDELSPVALGLKVPGIPLSTGQFSYQESYITFSENGLNLNTAYRWRASARTAEAGIYSLQDAQDVVALVVGTAYLQVLASQSRLETAKAQLETAKTLEEQTANQVSSGLSPEIDGFRATVQRQTSEQRVVVANANFEKDKLTLARLIGLPRGQQFNVASQVPYTQWNGPAIDTAVSLAESNRADLKSAQVSAQAARLDKKAAELQRLPGLSFNGYYGGIGPTLGNGQESYAMSATVSLPIFTGGRIRADIHDSSAQFDRKRSEYLDLQGRVDYEVRNAFTDLGAAESAVHVAEQNTRLAEKSLEQARDRFSNGVTNNLELLQAQQSVVAANENYISSLFAHNLAKLTLLRAMGSLQKDITQYLGGK